MLRFAPQSAGGFNPTPHRVLTVCVVDPRNEDYAGWQSLALTAGARIEVVASAEDALRLARTHRFDLWVVNAALPGLSGLDLCGMLNNRRERATVYVVADKYSPVVEQQAWQARATLFGCKGEHEPWLSAWLQTRGARPANRGATRSRPIHASP